MAVNFFNKLNSIEAPPYLAEMYAGIIAEGKKSSGLARLGENRSDLKYDPECLREHGAIACNEGELLYKMVRYFRPKNILEIGTWFGTSANFMAHALSDAEIDGTVYTCDKNNLFVAPHELIEYHNCLSEDLLKDLRRRAVQIDMVFTDGRLYPKDAKRIKSLMPNVLFSTHDYTGKEKGWRNVRALKKTYDNYDFYKDGGMMAFMIDRELGDA